MLAHYRTVVARKALLEFLHSICLVFLSLFHSAALFLNRTKRKAPLAKGSKFRRVTSPYHGHLTTRALEQNH